MPLPFFAIISALAAGGSLVPHAAGGMIVTSASGYVTGTYLSTTAIGGLLTAASGSLGTGALLISGAASSVAAGIGGAASGIIGSAGIFGTTIGASGLTGALMSVGLISATPIWVPIAAGVASVAGAATLGYGSYKLSSLKKKIIKTPEGEEAQFSKDDANIMEKIIKLLAKKKKPDAPDVKV